MANYCSYTMKVTGEKENVETLIKMMKWEGPFKDNGLGRIYDIYECDREEIAGGLVSVILDGGCAWSILSAMRELKPSNSQTIEKASKQLGLVIEAFSEESGCCFQEHVLIVKGEVIIDDCVDFEDHWIGEFETLEEYNYEYDTDFTEDMIDDEHIYIGGFGENYCNFRNHLEYIDCLATA